MFLASALSKPLLWAYVQYVRTFRIPYVPLWSVCTILSSSHFLMSGLGEHGGKGYGKIVPYAGRKRWFRPYYGGPLQPGSYRSQSNDGDGPTTQPNAVSSAAAGGVALTSANLDTFLGKTDTVNSIRKVITTMHDRLEPLLFPGHDDGSFTGDGPTTQPNAVLSGWFQTERFYFDFERPGSADIFFPAYCARFRRLGELPASVDRQIGLCILHDTAHEFPYNGARSDSMALYFGMQSGLDLQGSVSYGWVSRQHVWHPYCGFCQKEWVGWYCVQCNTQH